MIRRASVALPPHLSIALEDAKWRLRKTKREIVEEAVSSYLKKHGISIPAEDPRFKPGATRSGPRSSGA